MNAIHAFLEVMQAVFGRLNFMPVADGKIYRFHVPGDRHGKFNGWYVLHLHVIAYGCFGSWKIGVTHHWTSRKPANPLEAAQARQHVAQTKRQHDAEELQRQNSAAEYARGLLSAASPANPHHPYLVAKGCLPHRLRQRGNELLVPMYHDSQLVNVQRIFPDGTKRFLEGGMIKGCYSPIGHPVPGQSLTICEGWATGATLHEDTGAPVACAMSCHNLLAVGRHLRQRYPDIKLIIAGDDDRLTEVNPGRTAATKAAAALGCGLVFPQWPCNAPRGLSDFNDRRQWGTRQ
ncbi:topoisomerase [Pseudomonas putida]|uniref:Topoisomerase n=1 Tax=Pseudomonas putida TaxID=303 RepID=A0A2Z4RMB0_PSEPU|nr:toprim domain-containing protein [Pseudomonas putida]AWY42272.1 topoisomerase [Pseudomonas putida]